MTHPLDPQPPGSDRPTLDPSWPPLVIREGGFEDDEDRPPTAAAICVLTFLVTVIIFCGAVIWRIW